MTEQEVTTFLTGVEQEPVNGKYTQVLRTIKDGVDYEIHESLCPNGMIGYRVLIYKTEDDKDYVMSKGYAAEAESNTFSWREITPINPN